MPRFLIDIPDTEYTFVRPALISVVKDLIERTYFPKTDKIYVLGEGHVIPIPGSSISEGSSSRSVSTDNAVRIEITEDYNNTDYTNGSHPSQNTPPIFLDNDLNVAIRTLYMPVWYDINLTLRFSSISKAKSWVQRHSIATRLGRTSLEHKFTGSYPVSKTILLFLSDVYNKAKINNPAIGTVKEWINEHIVPRYLIVASQDGVKKSSMISDSHAGAIGGFEFDTTPDPITKIDANTYQASITYRVRLEKPVNFYATYPLLVNNTPIDSAFITKDHTTDSSEEVNPRSNRAVVLAKHYMTNMEYFSGSAGFPVPYYDDWCPNVISPYCAIALRMQIVVSNVDLKDVLNLRVLGGVGNDNDIIELNEELLDYISNTPEGVITLYGSPVNVSLYKGNNPLISDMLSLDNNLNLRTTEDMDILSNYHLVISLMYDLRFLAEYSKETLRKNPTFFIRLCEALYPGLQSRMLADANSSEYWKILTDGSISRPGFDEIALRGAKLYRSKKQKDVLFGNNIMSFTINARRQ